MSTVTATNSGSQPEQPKTIADFVADNEKLLTGLGGFAALTLFANTLPTKALGGALSVIFFTIMLMMWFELWAKFPDKGTTMLSAFENLLVLATALLGFHLLIDINRYMPAMITMVVFMVMLTPISYALKRYNLFNRITGAKPGGKKGLRYLLATTLVLSISFIAWIASATVSPAVCGFLDQAYKELSNPTAFRKSVVTPTATPTGAQKTNSPKPSSS